LPLATPTLSAEDENKISAAWPFWCEPNSNQAIPNLATFSRELYLSVGELRHKVIWSLLYSGVVLLM